MAGSPATVRRFLQERSTNLDTLVSHFFFGNLTYAQTSRSLDLFASNVMPALVESGELRALSI